MAISDTFDGAADQAVSARAGWVKHLASGVDFMSTTGSGGAKMGAYTSGTPSLLVHNTGVPDHFAQCRVGAGVLAGSGNGAYLLAVRQTLATTGIDCAVYYSSNYESLYFNTGEAVAATLADNDLLRLEAQGTEARLYRNGSLILSKAIPASTQTHAGFGGGYGAAINPFINEFSAGELAAADTTAPTLSAASATAVSHSAATGSITTDEAGPAWAVLTTSATAPSVARVKAGLDHTGVGAAAADTANLVVGANAPAFAFTGLSGSATYYLHVVQDDTATPPNTSTVATSASFATPAAPKHATYQFDVDEAGTDAASVTGLTWAWYEAYPPALAALPLLSGTAGSTDASGVFDVVLTGTALNVGDTGTLVICKGDGVEGSVANIGFIGPVEVR